MKITLDIPEKWKDIKMQKDLSWRHIMGLGFRKLEENDDVYKQ